MKKFVSLLLILTFIFTLTSTVSSAYGTKSVAEGSLTTSSEHTVNARSAFLMEAETGETLYSYNENERFSPASVTKVMTLLLIMEGLESGKIGADDNVTVSAYAASMGGSQVFLEEGESMSVTDLIKCTVIASANDAAVALAEHLYGSEKTFVTKMNKRASELGMENTFFENVTGLDDTTTNHLTSAKDIAIMSRELIKYDMIRKYSSLWQDSIRNGEFILTNTNRLVRYYDGCNGLKTGSTDKAGYCMSATAKRDGMQLIAVIMGAETRDVRNAEARSLLDYGFANYALYSLPERMLEEVPINYGSKGATAIYSAPFKAIIEKGKAENVNMIFEIPESIDAPIREKEQIGKVIYKLGDNVIGESSIYSLDNIEKASIGKLFASIIKSMFY